MERKEQFIEKLKQRTKIFAVDIIKFCDNLKTSSAVKVVSFQLLKSVSSIGENYRAACRARSNKEFFSKLCIVVEEADETAYWLEIINESNLFKDKNELERLLKEANEILKIMATAKNTIYKKSSNK